MTIRPFVAPDDYEATAELGAVCFPDHERTVEEMRFADAKRDAKLKFGRFVAEEDGRLIGFAEYGNSNWVYHPQKFFLMLMVHPDYRQRGIGGALYDRMEQAMAEYDPIAYRTFGNEAHTHTLNFLAKRGFVEEMRTWESRLDVAKCDLTPFEKASEKVAAQGIVIKTYEDLADYPNRNPVVYDLFNMLMADVPSPEPFTPTEFEEWEKHLDAPGFLPDANWIAFDGDKPIGLTGLSKSLAGKFLETGLTGVLPEYRGRSIASALKYRAVAYARDKGAPYIRTDNAVSNAPMLSINERLGFEKQPAWISFARQFKEEEAPSPP